jgi:hypothetical protein
MNEHPVIGSSDAEVPFLETRLIAARLLLDILRQCHSALNDLPFMRAVELHRVRARTSGGHLGPCMHG